MPFEIVRNDITKMHVDAIVNPTNTKLFGTAGVDGAIYKIEGSKLKFVNIERLSLLKSNTLKFVNTIFNKEEKRI